MPHPIIVCSFCFFLAPTLTPILFYTRRFPGLRSFLKDGGVAQYREVAVHYVRDPQAVLHVYEGSREIDTVQLTELRTTERLHAVMQRYFERKSDEEIQRDQNRQTLQRQQKAYQKFHRAEYVRQQHLHAQQFRREIMQARAHLVGEQGLAVQQLQQNQQGVCHYQRRFATVRSSVLDETQQRVVVVGLNDYGAMTSV